MTSRTSSASLCLKALPPLPPSFPDIPETIEESDITSSLIEGKRSPLAKSSWFIDAADLFVLLCSFLLAGISIVFVTHVLYLQATQGEPTTSSLKTLSSLQRVISSLSVTITSAVIMVAGKRYVLFKLAKGGLRSRRVAVYGNPSIGALVSYLILHGAELPLLGLSAMWILGLATSLTANSSWELESISLSEFYRPPSGPLDLMTPGSSLITQATAQLSYTHLAVCMGLEKEHGLINMTNTTDYLLATVYYPPLEIPLNVDFSIPATMNGFNTSTTLLNSMPPNAQKLNCYDSSYGTGWSLWSNGHSNNQTLSIIVGLHAVTVTQQDGTNHTTQDISQFDATAIVMGGTLSSTGNYIQFSRNGTSWPNVMSNDSHWAQDITTLICNTTFRAFGDRCQGSSLIDIMNGDEFGPAMTSFYSILSMALGAYTWAMYANAEHSPTLPAYGTQLTSQYGIYILIPHIVASLVMLVVVMKLRLASPLGADFINSTRLLLHQLKKPELFNASLDTTLDALGDPYMMIGGGELLITEGKTPREKKD